MKRLVPDVHADRAFPRGKRVRQWHHRLELSLAGHKLLHTAVERKVLEEQVNAVFLAELYRFKSLFMGCPAKLQHGKARIHAVADHITHMAAARAEGGENEVVLPPMSARIAERMTVENFMFHRFLRNGFLPIL